MKRRLGRAPAREYCRCDEPRHGRQDGAGIRRRDRARPERGRGTDADRRRAGPVDRTAAAHHRAVAFGVGAARRPAGRRRAGAPRDLGRFRQAGPRALPDRARRDLFDAARAARRRITEAALGRLSGEERRALDGIVAKMFPALVGPGDDDEVVCRLCDETVCPMERCPVPQHHQPIEPKLRCLTCLQVICIMHTY